VALRGLEGGPLAGAGVVVPLGGQRPGHCRVAELPGGTEAGPREMDRPGDRQRVLLEFELR